METFDWYYIYSQRYHPFHLYLQDKIPRTMFTPIGVFVDQSVFDEHLYKHEGEHFFGRITIKVETILRILSEKRCNGDTRPFYFSDCDILIGDLVGELTVYPGNEKMDVWFQREYKDSTTVNPGIMLIRPNEKTEIFWSHVLNDMKTTEKSMELQSINKVLESSDISWNLFLTTSVCSSITKTTKFAGDFGVYHILCACDSRELDIGNKMFEACNLKQPMDKYVEQTRVELGRLFF